MNKLILKNMLTRSLLNSEGLDNLISNMNNILNRYKRKDVNNILISQLNSMGDLVLAIPAIRELRKNYPNSHITLICDHKYIDLIKLSPYVNEIIPCDITDINVFNFLPAAINFCYKYLWNRIYNIAINLHWSCNSFISSIIQWLAITNHNIGYSFDAERQYFNSNFNLQNFLDALHIDKYILTKAIINPYTMFHELDRKLYLLEACNLQVENRQLEVYINNASLQFAKNLLSSINNRKIIIGLGSSNEVKRYSATKLLIALKKIVKDNNTLILLGSGPQEFEDSKYIEKHIPCVNLVNKLALNEAIAIISLSNLYIGNDTGLMHVAVACDKYVIYYICQAKNKTTYTGSCSEKDRFRPYHNKYIVLQPENALDKCNEIETYGGCSANLSHCINQINPQEIIKAYYKIKKYI